jgi:hypothetical protein
MIIVAYSTEEEEKTIVFSQYSCKIYLLRSSLVSQILSVEVVDLSSNRLVNKNNRLISKFSSLSVDNEHNKYKIVLLLKAIKF